MLIDSHVHLDDEMFDQDRDAVILRAKEAGVCCMINIGADMLSSARAVSLASQYPEIYAAVGIHPHDAEKMAKEDEKQLAVWTGFDKVVAVGEIGLDYYYDLSPREIQKKVFIRQLDIARQMHMPVVIHNRDAHGDTMNILKREGQGLTGVIHCFSGSLEMAEELIKMGWYIGFDGPVTFKNAARLPEIAAKIPLERILIETDSPYLTPVPFRGKRNEPSYVRLVAERIAELRGMYTDDFCRAAAQNTCNLFGIKL